MKLFNNLFQFLIILFLVSLFFLTSCSRSKADKSVDLGSNIKIDLILVNSGSFLMGTSEEIVKDMIIEKYRETGFNNEEIELLIQDIDLYDYYGEIQHKVSLTNDYYISKYPVTQEQWKAVMNDNPSSFEGADKPVETVSWFDVQDFIRQLNRLTNKEFRLPTEAEWEFAARGGNKSNNYIYSGSNDVFEVAWFDRNSYFKGLEHPEFGARPVGQKKPNELGIYDMSGNVFEWCQDWYGVFSAEPKIDPAGSSSGNRRVIRGGSWFDDSEHCRVDYRASYDPNRKLNDLGFRLVLPVN